jgi:hypothetical protein
MIKKLKHTYKNTRIKTAIGRLNMAIVLMILSVALVASLAAPASADNAPTITSISPNSKNVGDATFTMTVTGTNFVFSSKVKIDGTNSPTTTYYSATSLTASIPISYMTSAGTHSITVYNGGGSTSNAQTFTVNKATPIITWSNPADITYGTALSGTQLNAIASVSGTFIYTPPATTVLNAGTGQTLHVAFTPTDTVNYNSASKDVTINVLKATPTITWGTPADITYGTALSGTQLNAATSTPGSFVYTPASGTVLSAGAGQTLHAAFTPTDTVNYNSASKDVGINVLKATPTITWSTPADITYGTALSGTQLNAATSTPGSFVYTPASGTVLSAGAGQTLHAAFTPTDTANYNSASKDVSITVLKATPTITWGTPADITYGTALGGTQLNAATSTPGSFVYTPASGTVLSAGAGQTLHVDFTPTDTVNYNSGSADVTINVLKVTPVITWSNPAGITYGTALSATQLNAVEASSIAGTFAYTPASGTVLSAGPGQTLSVVFTPTDTTNYNSASKDVTINVNNKVTPVITWGNPTDITYGTALSGTQLNAVEASSIPGTFTYTPASGTVLSAGATQTLHVDFTPIDTVNYNSASADVTINVLKVTPVITWSTPADITYGTALSGTQLNAVEASSIAGTFAYTPASGTVLSAGPGQTLHVDFTPTDTVNYNSASKDVTITVLKVTPVITWANPADITSGTALSATQLNAAASVPGDFVYNPADGFVLGTGANQILNATFTPSDPTNYTVAYKEVTINVTGTLPTGRYINGTVMDSLTHEVLAGVTVSTTGASSVTDGSGKYSLAVVSGSYPLTASYDIRYNTNSSVTVSTEFVAVVNQDIELLKKPTGNITGSVKHA